MIAEHWRSEDAYYNLRRRLPKDSEPPAPPPADPHAAIAAWVAAQDGVFTVAQLRAAVPVTPKYNVTATLRRLGAVRVGWGRYRPGLGE